MTGDPDLVDLDRFMIKKNTKTGNIELLFIEHNNQWQSLTNNGTSEFLAPKTFRKKFGGVNTMKSVLSLDQTLPSIERLISATTRIKAELPTDLQIESIPLKDLLSLVADIHVKTREASNSVNLDMREFLGIDKALQIIQGELLNNTSKLSELSKRIKRHGKKLQEVENDFTNKSSYTEIDYTT